MRRLVYALIAFLGFTCGSALTQTSMAGSPNVVVIMADDMGYSDLGCFGGEIKTPNLDRLASGGLRFTNFYSENMCWVSRAAMLTGVYHKTSMFKNSVHPRCLTLPESLSQSGYQTYMSGKWHLAGKPYHIFPVDRGFDEFYGILGGAASFFAPAFLSRNRTNVEAEANLDPDYYLTHAISDEAVRMIGEADAAKPIRSILFATDFSEDAKQAERIVARWARLLHSDVEIFHSIREAAVLFAPYAMSGSSADESELHEAAAIRMKSSLDRFKAAGVSARAKIVHGSPPEEISDRAATIGCQVIAMGSRGYTGLQAVRVGSVAQRVLRNAPCNVLIAGSRTSDLTQFDRFTTAQEQSHV
jgi:arylsulfatase A-like enzyme